MSTRATLYYDGDKLHIYRELTDPAGNDIRLEWTDTLKYGENPLTINLRLPPEAIKALAKCKAAMD